MPRLFSVLLLLAVAACRPGQTQRQSGSGGANPAQPGQGLAILNRALANEYKAAQDASYPMRYELRKTSPHWSSTKKICETKDGDVARLVELNGQPLSSADEQKEEARLTELAGDPAKQHRRKQAEDADQGRVLKVLRVLPSAFVYQDAGAGDGPAGKSGDSPSSRIQKFTFRPNPAFSAPDLETQVLTQMAGEIWIDPVHLRVVRLEGHLVQDVDFGWGILGRLNKGGWIAIDQADVGGGQWRTVHFKMVMSGRVVWKTRVFDTSEDESGYEPVPPGLGYQKAIEILRADK